MLGDTIAAISTATGEAGIGIIRVSGDDALSVVGKIFVPANPERFATGQGYRLYYGRIVDPETSQNVDEVLVSVMRKPHSFTGEDVVEVNCHGGVIALSSTLNLLLRYGARLAEAGEFTKRAFLNGRLDLAQAEAVIDLIRAKTPLSAMSAVEQLKGRLSEEVSQCREILLGVLANIEASVDFPEDDLELAGNEQLIIFLEQTLNKLKSLLDMAERGKILRDGLHTVIIGQPNVGKSSLLNALLREERAIVTDIPGTTRDVLEEYINLKGIPLKLVDTAGIRDTDDLVEKLGVDRALQTLQKADLVLYVVEGGKALTPKDQELLAKIPREKLVIVVNKIDLSREIEFTVDVPVFYVSALHNLGIAEFENGLVELVAGKQKGETPVVSNVRHISAIETASAKIRDAIGSLASDIPLDLVSIDVRSAWELLGEITGDTVSEDLLDEIFSRFCIGK